MSDFTFSGSTLTGYTGAGGAITLPTSNGGTTITTIGLPAWAGNTNVTSITIPSTYTTINEPGAFYGYSSLVSINASASNITRIGESTFHDCQNLITVSLPNTLTSIGISAFRHCLKIINITFPNSLQTIDNNAFLGCRGITSLSFNSGLRTIGVMSFLGCENLESITFNEGLESIGVGAFRYCPKLTIVYMPYGTSYVETGSDQTFNAGVTVIRNSPPAVPCFTAGTLILTPGGEVAVETLNAGDLVTTASGLIVPLKSVLTTRVAVTTAETAPFLIPGGTYGSAQPRDIILSPTHAFQMRRGIWMVPVKATATKSAVRQVGVGEPVTYYHLECPVYLRDNLVANGCIVESFGGRQTKTNQYTYSKRFNGYTRASFSSSATHAALR
jgi:hypothetical protein